MLNKQLSGYWRTSLWVRSSFASTAFAAALAAMSPAAHAAYSVYLYEDGANVSAFGSGSINITALSRPGRGFDIPLAIPTIAALYLGASSSIDLYSGFGYGGFTGPSSFGWGDAIYSDFFAGASVVFSKSNDLIGVPVGYVSGAELGPSTATWLNTTLDDMGAVTGVYTWTWGSGAGADSYTLHVGEAPSVPEPATLALLVAPLTAFAFRHRRV